MGVYTIKYSQEGVDALKIFASALMECLDEIDNAANTLQSEYSEYSSKLGAHSEQILELIEDIWDVQKTAAEPVYGLQDALNCKANKMQEMLDNNYYG